MSTYVHDVLHVEFKVSIQVRTRVIFIEPTQQVTNFDHWHGADHLSTQ